jgi:hypothetical protein
MPYTCCVCALAGATYIRVYTRAFQARSMFPVCNRFTRVALNSYYSVLVRCSVQENVQQGIDWYIMHTHSHEPAA